MSVQYTHVAEKYVAHGLPTEFLIGFAWTHVTDILFSDMSTSHFVLAVILSNNRAGWISIQN